VIDEAGLGITKLAGGFALDTGPVDLERAGDQYVVPVLKLDVETRFHGKPRCVGEVRVRIAAWNENQRLQLLTLLWRWIAAANREAIAAGACESTSSVTWAASRLGSCLCSSSSCCS